MIYRFADFDVLRLALTSGAVPSATALAPARARCVAGEIFVAPAKALPKKADAELRRLGVLRDQADGDLDLDVGNWLQLFPLMAEPTANQLGHQTPVLFDLADAEQLPALVGEMLRLGNDRQAFRVLRNGAADRVLLRVIGPPYYSLLRALDAGPTTAYVERRPRLWVRLGCTHPLLETITPAAGEILLLSPPRQWHAVKEGPFQDIYEILDFQVPTASAPLQPSTLQDKLVVPLRLGASGTNEAAEMWVLTRRAIEQIDSLVRELDEAVINRLAFAVGQPNDAEPVVVLKARPGKQAPPVLVLDALACRHYLKLANLYMPVGSRLQPPLRRDAVRKLLAVDDQQVVWLTPAAAGRFTPCQLPDAAFRPLKDWVDYILDHDHQAITTWMQATTFDFESFLCTDDAPPPRAKPPGKRRRNPESPAAEPAAPVADPPLASSPAPPTTALDPVERLQPSAAQRELSRLEQEFLALDGPLDSPPRQALWPRLAELNAMLGRGGDATACWLNACWENERWTPPPQQPAADLAQLLAKPEPTADDLRGLAIQILRNGQDAAKHASRLRQYLEQHEAGLPVRLLWLAWLTLAHGDALGLARARDRILDRLLAGGLHHEHDLPSFLRYERGGDRFRLVRDRLLRLHELARDWSLTASGETTHCDAFETTIAYIDLVFAHGFARLGEQSASRDLHRRAEEVLAHRDEVHALLFQAFTYRLEQVQAGQPAAGVLPSPLLAQLEALQDPAYKELNSRYKIDRLRQRSRILEPQESVDVYSRRISSDEIQREIVRWTDTLDPAELEERVRKLLHKVRTAESRYRVIKAGLRLAPRIGHDLTLELLDQVLPVLNGLPPIYAPSDLPDATELLERALFLAAHFDRGDLVQQLVAKFLFYLNEVRRIQGKLELVENLAEHSFRGLHKLGLRAQVGVMLGQLDDLVFQGRGLEQLRQELDAESWSTTLVTLLHLATGWACQGDLDRLPPVVAAARELLLSGWLSKPGKGYLKMKIARAYVAALAQGDTEAALAGIEELFQRMGGFPEIGTWNSHYFVLQIQFVEAVVLAIVSDDFAMGQTARRWLDEDEYLVRRRIHRDVRQVVG